MVRQSTFQFVELVGSDLLNSPHVGINLGLLALGDKQINDASTKGHSINNYSSFCAVKISDVKFVAKCILAVKKAFSFREKAFRQLSFSVEINQR